MAVDLAELIPNLKAQINVPGADPFSTVTESDWLLRLENAFWNARLDGLFTNYTAADGLIQPISGTTDLSRDQQQLILLYAAFDIVLTELRNAQSSFRAQAGPVEYETQRSAPLLREVLRAVQDRIKVVVGNLSAAGVADVVSLDAVIARTQSMGDREVWWVR